MVNEDVDGKQAVNNLLAGIVERYQAIQNSISEGSWQPLQTSFSNQFQNMFPQSGDSPKVAFNKNMNLALSVAGGGEGGIAETISKNEESLIQIGKQELSHVVEGHAWNTSLPDKSTFLKGIDPVKLINQASEADGTIQSRTGNIQRTITGANGIGIDRVTSQVTNTYTVITRLLDSGGEALVTAFPGIPKK